MLAVFATPIHTFGQSSLPEASAPVAEAAIQAGARSLDELFEGLAAASLREKRAIVDELAISGEPSVAALFAAMSAGELYYQAETRRMFRLTDSDAAAAMIDISNGEAVPQPTAEALEKVRVNNVLRRQLNRHVARLNLTQGERNQRLAAVSDLLGALNNDTAATLEQAAETEDDVEILTLMLTGLALHDLETSEDPNVQMQAIAQLDGRLEMPVRNALANVAVDESGNADVQAAAAAALDGIEAKLVYYRVLEQLFFGLSQGSVLLLAAAGLAVTFGVMGVINMAHGEMLMLGAYTTWATQQLMPSSIGASLILSIPAAFVVAGIVGIAIQRFVIRHLEGRPLETLLATFGISLILQQSVRTVFSPLNRMVSSPEWMTGSLQINPVLSVTYNRIYILLFALLVFVLLQLILHRTSLGLQVRAVTQNRDMARAMGIRTDWVDALTFGLGTGIAGIAGVALSQLTNVGPGMGQSYIIDSFMVVVFGGVGNLLGTLVGAFSIGTVSNFLEPLSGAVLAKIFVLCFVIVFIQKRPTGLFPQKGRALG